MAICTKIDATPLQLDSGVYHLRYNHRALKAFERETNRRSYLDFLQDADAIGKMSASDLIALIWAGIYGYQGDKAPAIEEVESWVNPSNMNDFAEVVGKAIDTAFGEVEEKKPQKKASK